MVLELHCLQCAHPFMTGTGTTDKRLNEESILNRDCGRVGILWSIHIHVSTVSGIDSDRICAVYIKTNSLVPILVKDNHMHSWMNTFATRCQCACVQECLTIISSSVSSFCFCFLFPGSSESIRPTDVLVSSSFRIPGDPNRNHPMQSLKRV